MKFGRKVRCILFDLGGTLWARKEARVEHTCERIANLQAVLELFRYAGSGFHPEMDVDELGQLLRKSFERQIRDKTRQQVEYEPDFVLAAMNALHQLGVPGVTREFAEAIYEAPRVRSPDSRAVFDDALSPLADLSARGYLLVLVTTAHYRGAPFHK